MQGGATPDGVPPSLSRQLHEPSATALRQNVSILRDGDPVTGDTNGLSSLVEVEAHSPEFGRAKLCPYDMQ